jgi:hypothetical protein
VTTSALAPRIPAQIAYLLPSSKVNRRYAAPHEEINTGRYTDYPVDMRDGSGLEGRFQADVHGFQLLDSPTRFSAWQDREAVAAEYEPEQLKVVQELLGAERVAPLGCALRTSGDAAGRKMQPPGAEAHVDFEANSARQYADMVFRERFAEAPPYRRFVAFSFWRPLTPPPHDWPLAVCDFRSVDPQEGERNVLVWCDEIPPEERWLDPIPGEETFPAAYIFRHNPAHQWWCFPKMSPQQALFIKFHDSDRSRAWRCPHSAFRNGFEAEPNVRESIEFRGMAFFD